jgi:hypothetical protein
LQNEQLKEQQKQFEIEQKRQEQIFTHQQEELKAQIERSDLQQHSIKLQNFESSFFQLLNQQNQIVTSMRTSAGEIQARSCFGIWYQQKLLYTFQNEWRKSPKTSLGISMQRSVSDEKQYAIKSYDLFYKDYQHELGHYFRNLYHIFKFVNESDPLKSDDVEIDYRNRRRYTSLARAQLSVYELCILFYNGLCSEGEKFKPLIEKYGLLENLHNRKDILLHPTHASNEYYDPKAFE